MRYLIAACLLCVSLFVIGQPSEPLVIGRPFPYKGLLKFSGSKDSLSIADFKGRRVIIELFGPTCSVCFEALPKINELQKKYQGEVDFLLVGYETGATAAVYQKFKEKLRLQLKVAFDRKLFHSILYEAWPTYIWIDPNGNIQAVTVGPEQTNSENLEKFINGLSMEFLAPPKQIPFNSSLPYLIGKNGGEDSNYQIRTIISDCTPGLPISMPIDMKFRDGRKFINLINCGIVHLYNYAYWGQYLRNFGDSQYGKIWTMPIMDSAEDTGKHYCFSIAYQGSQAPDPLPIMQNYLKAYLNYNVKIETRAMPYWSFTVDSEKIKKLRSKANSYKGNFNFAGFEYEYVDMKFIIRQLSYMDKDPFTPYLDETGIGYKIDLKIDAPLTERDFLIKALALQGIIVTKRQKPMQVLVLSKNKIAATP